MNCTHLLFDEIIEDIIASSLAIILGADSFLISKQYQLSFQADCLRLLGYQNKINFFPQLSDIPS
jgi:hypothetical protein